MPTLPRSRGQLLWPLVVTLAPSVATASLVVESRFTQLEASTQFGYVGGANSQTDSKSYTSLTTDLQVTLAGANSGEGALGDGSWIANFNYTHFQDLVWNAQGWEASGSTDLFAFVGDQGVATIDAQQGNRLELGFRVDAPTTYHFSGAFTGLADVQLDQSFGSNLWTPVADPVPGGFELTLTLAPGHYRLLASGGGYHDGASGMGSAWTARLTAVPEPAPWALGVTGVLAVVAAVGFPLQRRR